LAPIAILSRTSDATPHYIARRVRARGERTQRVFDEGNAPSVLAIRMIRSAGRGDLEEPSGVDHSP
jgi:hypothetical protein